MLLGKRSAVFAVASVVDVFANTSSPTRAPVSGECLAAPATSMVWAPVQLAEASAPTAVSLGAAASAVPESAGGVAVSEAELQDVAASRGAALNAVAVPLSAGRRLSEEPPTKSSLSSMPLPRSEETELLALELCRLLCSSTALEKWSTATKGVALPAKALPAPPRSTRRFGVGDTGEHNDDWPGTVAAPERTLRYTCDRARGEM